MIHRARINLVAVPGGAPSLLGVVNDPVSGFAHERFAGVRSAFADNLSSGADLGASFCLTIDGETVVDLWGGFADEDRTRPWQADTIVNVYSTTKTMTALTALLVADRGELEKWQKTLDDLGINHGGIVDAHYGSGLSFKDPDNIALEFFAPPA